MATGRRPPPGPFSSRPKTIAGLLALAVAAGFVSYGYFSTRTPQAKPVADETTAAADGASPWVPLGETLAMRVYWDRSSMLREDSVVRVWEIQDLQAPDPDSVRSRRYRSEYDCKHRMHRIGNMVSFSGPMLTGDKLFDVEEMGYWRQIPPASVFAQGFALHCGRLPLATPAEAEREMAPWWAPFWPFN